MFLIAPYWTLLEPNYEKEIIILEGFNGYKLNGSGFECYFVYSWCCYIVPFFIGLHFTYLDYFPFLQSITITRSELKKLHFSHWLLLGIGGILVSSILVYHIYLFFQNHLLIIYGSTVGVLTIMFCCCCFYYTKRKNMVLHIHHFQIGAFLMVFTPFQNVISSICQALAAGLFVEGISRWGMDSTFKIG